MQALALLFVLLKAHIVYKNVDSGFTTLL